MSESTYYAFCPFCGRKLFKGEVRRLELQCPKCNETIDIRVKDGELSYIADRKNVLAK